MSLCTYMYMYMCVYACIHVHINEKPFVQINGSWTHVRVYIIQKRFVIDVVIKWLRWAHELLSEVWVCLFQAYGHQCPILSLCLFYNMISFTILWCCRMLVISWSMSQEGKLHTLMCLAKLHTRRKGLHCNVHSSCAIVPMYAMTFMWGTVLHVSLPVSSLSFSHIYNVSIHYYSHLFVMLFIYLPPILCPSLSLPLLFLPSLPPSLFPPNPLPLLPPSPSFHPPSISLLLECTYTWTHTGKGRR